MKIVVTGGMTGGHFYPIIAVVESLKEIVKEKKLLEPKIYFISPDPYNKRVLFDNGITYKYVTSGKRRLYKSFENYIDLLKIFFGVIQATWKLFWIFPDVVFSKGGFGAFPVVTAARMLGIPVVMHESDSVPGRVSLYTSKFAKKVAISYPYVAEAFPEKVHDKIVWTGQPIRKEIKDVSREGAFEYLDLDPTIPVLFVLGGSQGAQIINEVLLDALPRLVQRVQIVHQTGKQHFKIVSSTADVTVEDPILRKRYRPYEYLNDLDMRMTAGAASLAITRAGSTLFELASWGLPAIVVPIDPTVSRDQHQNAFNFARAGAGTVIEENNLSDDVLIAEIYKLLDDPLARTKMSEAGKKISRPDAAKLIAEEILTIALSHES